MQFSMLLPFYLFYFISSRFVFDRVYKTFRKKTPSPSDSSLKEVTSFENPFNLNLSPGVFARNYEKPSIKMQTSENDCGPIGVAAFGLSAWP